MSKQSLRIAMLSVHSSPLGQPGIGDTGGMSIYIRELSSELVKQGHVVDIYTRSQDAGLPEIVDLSPGARLIHIQAGEPVDLDKLLIYSHAPDVACKTETFRKQHDLHYDIIFSHYWISGISGLYLKTWWQTPHITMFHTLGAVKNAIGIGEDEPELRIQEERLIAHECDRIIAPTLKEQHLLSKYYDVATDRVSIVPCGVNFEVFQIADPVQSREHLGLGKEKVILFVGRIERLKGIDRLIRSLPYLADLQPKLLVVGEDGNRQGETQNLKILAQQLGVSDSVIFPGLIDYEKLPVFYNSADVTVLPSYYESFGLVPLESLACGTPVVATEVGDLQNIIREGITGFVIPDNQPRSLADKIRLVLNGSSPGFKNRSFIRQSISAYDWQKIAELLIKIFQNITNKSPVRA